jgi:hypothetical protein
MIAAIKGKPVRNAFLSILAAVGLREVGLDTHNNNPKTKRLQASLQGNSGSQTLFLNESPLSQPTKTIQPRPESTNDAMTGALFQGYSTPACSRAKTRRMEAANEANAPRKSIRLHAFSETRVLKKLAGPGYGKLKGMEMLMRSMATAPAGPLTRKKKHQQLETRVGAVESVL